MIGDWLRAALKRAMQGGSIGTGVGINLPDRHPEHDGGWLRHSSRDRPSPPKYERVYLARATHRKASNF